MHYFGKERSKDHIKSRAESQKRNLKKMKSEYTNVDDRQSGAIYYNLIAY